MAQEAAPAALTIHDIARAAGVSTATVSRALRALPGVSDVTRARVLATAAALDYVVSPAASRLSSGRTGSVAVVTPYLARWYFATVLAAINEELSTDDLDLLLVTVDEPSPATRPTPAHRLRRRVDGVIVVSVSPQAVALAEITRLAVPTVVIGLTSRGATSVRSDDVNGAAMAAQHLLNLGHRRIGLIHGRTTSPVFVAERDRLVGFRRALDDAGLEPDPTIWAPGSFTAAGGEEAMSQLLARPDPPTAVFAMSDEMAFGALAALRRHGLRPGTDLSVIGYDDHDLAATYDLTTVHQPVVELGHIAASVLRRQVVGAADGGDGAEPARPGEDVVLPVRLVARGSTGPARG